MPEKLRPSDRDSSIVKKRKEQVADVLADIAKAASFVDQIYTNEKTTPKKTPNIKK